VVTFLPRYQFNCVSQYLNITPAVRGVQWMSSLGLTLKRRGLISDRELYLIDEFIEVNETLLNDRG